MKLHLTQIAATLAAAAICLPAVAKEYRSADVHPEDYPTVMAGTHVPAFSMWLPHYFGYN